MTAEGARVVLSCGDVISIAPARGLGDRIREAVSASPRKLYLLERRFSTQAAVVVSDDPSVKKGFVRQAVEAGIPVVSEEQALEAIALLNSPLERGWCDCEAPEIPPEDERSWEHHDFGVCGWPERRCEMPEHRHTWCRCCRRVIRLRFCNCAGEYLYSYDRDRRWWVHTGCGWPTKAWFVVNGERIPDAVDGTPSWLWHLHEARTALELGLRPLPGEVAALDRQWAGRMVED